MSESRLSPPLVGVGFPLGGGKRKRTPPKRGPRAIPKVPPAPRRGRGGPPLPLTGGVNVPRNRKIQRTTADPNPGFFTEIAYRFGLARRASGRRMDRYFDQKIPRFGRVGLHYHARFGQGDNRSRSRGRSRSRSRSDFRRNGNASRTGRSRSRSRKGSGVFQGVVSFGRWRSTLSSTG